MIQLGKQKLSVSDSWSKKNTEDFINTLKKDGIKVDDVVLLGMATAQQLEGNRPHLMKTLASGLGARVISFDNTVFFGTSPESPIFTNGGNEIDVSVKGPEDNNMTTGGPA